MILHLCERYLFPAYPSLQFAQQIPNCFILSLIDKADWLKLMRLVRSEHFALAAGRFMAIQAKIVQADAMVPALLTFLRALEDKTDDVGKLVDEATAVSKLSLDGLPAVGALSFHFQTGGDAKLAIDFGAVRAESGLVGPAVADLTVDKFLVLLPGLVQFTAILLRRGLKHHYNIISKHKEEIIKDINACWSSIFPLRLV